MNFNEQMAQFDSEIDSIIKHNLKSNISKKGKEAYGELGCASTVKRLFDIIKADPKNQALMREICQAERELIAFLFDEPNALSEQKIIAYWSKYTNAYVTEVQQPPSLYYLLIKAADPHSGEKRSAGNIPQNGYSQNCL